jgi:hypothetical protein
VVARETGIDTSLAGREFIMLVKADAISVRAVAMLAKSGDTAFEEFSVAGYPLLRVVSHADDDDGSD